MRFFVLAIAISGCFGSHGTDDDIDVPDGGTRWTDCWEALYEGHDGEPCAFDESCSDLTDCGGFGGRELMCLGGELVFFERTCTIAAWSSCDEYLAIGGLRGDACVQETFGECYREIDGCCVRGVRCTGGLVDDREECHGPCGDFCPDYEPPPPELASCRSTAACADGNPCVPPGTPRACGICFPAERNCADHADCPEGSVCSLEEQPCSCDGPSSFCVARCTDTSCPEGESCGADGLCAAIDCNTGLYECPLNMRCHARCGACDEVPPLDAHSCWRMNCAFDTDCDCGACVDGLCQSGPGACTPPVP